jgi:hypothetical protein
VDRNVVRVAAWMRVARSLSTVALASPLMAAPLRGQTLIPDTPTCAQCTITMTPVVTLQGSASLAIPARPLAVTVDGLGRYWLTFPGGKPFAMVFGADGNVIRQLGPEGTGPDQYGSATPVIALPGDSLLVYDGRQQRFNVLSSDLVFRRQIDGDAHAWAFAPLDWPRLVVAKQAEGVEVENGRPVYLRRPHLVVTMDGTAASLVRSIGFGGTGGVLASGADAFWTWDYNPYRLERWSKDGRLLGNIERRPSWHFPGGEHPARTVGQLAPSHLQGLLEDSAGRLWVFVNEGVMRWESESVPISRQMEKHFNARVEVIDPIARTLYASVLLPAFIISPLPGMRAAVSETDAAGKPVVRIVQLALSGGEQKR